MPEPEATAAAGRPAKIVAISERGRDDHDHHDVVRLMLAVVGEQHLEGAAAPQRKADCWLTAACSHGTQRCAREFEPPTAD